MNSAYDRAIRNWEMLKTQMDTVGSSERSKSIAAFLFAPNENLEILIANLTELDGEADFESFMSAHSVLVAYISELDSYVQGFTKFSPDGLDVLAERYKVRTAHRARLDRAEDIAGRLKTFLQIKDFLAEFLPRMNHVLFDDADCPEGVYRHATRLLTDSSAQTDATNDAQGLLPSAQRDASHFRTLAADWLDAMGSPRTADSMTAAVKRYLTLTAADILAGNEIQSLAERQRRVQLELDEASRLTNEEDLELTAFQRNRHSVYSTGIYAAHAHAVTPKILVKLAQEFKAAGAAVSFDIKVK